VVGRILILMVWLTVGIPVHAVQAADGSRWTMGVGYAVIAPNARTSGLEIDGNPLPGAKMLVSDERANLLWLRRRLGKDWAVSTALGKPLTVETQLHYNVTGQTIPALPIEAAPLMLTVHYAPQALRFRGLQPYVGAGGVYVLVDACEFNEGFNNFSEQWLGQRPNDFDMDQPWHVLWELGADYRISDHWKLNGRVLGFSGSSRARIKFDGGAVMEVDMEYAPRIYSLSLEYQF